MNAKTGFALLLIAATIAFATALAHLSCIFLGPECYSAQMAPPVVVESAKANTLLAPVGTVIVSAIFGVLGCYALSGAKLLPRLPLLNIGIYAIATVCIIRGLLPLQYWLRFPDRVDTDVLIVGLVWLFVGLCYVLGFRAVATKR